MAVSWFPKPNAWDNCGMDFGYWTEDCERWYIKRVKDCIAGVDVVLRTASSWRNALRADRHAKSQHVRNEGFARQVCQAQIQ